MSQFVNIYSDKHEIVAQVNLTTRSVQVDKTKQTALTIPQTYIVIFLMDNFERPIIQYGIHRFNGISDLSRLVAHQVFMQGGKPGRSKYRNQDLERLTDKEYFTILANHFLSREALVASKQGIGNRLWEGVLSLLPCNYSAVLKISKKVLS